MLSKTAAVKTGREVLYKAAARRAVVGHFTTGRWPRMCVKALSECCRHRAGRPSRSVGGKCVPGRDSHVGHCLGFSEENHQVSGWL